MPPKELPDHHGNKPIAVHLESKQELLSLMRSSGTCKANIVSKLDCGGTATSERWPCLKRAPQSVSSGRNDCGFDRTSEQVLRKPSYLSGRSSSDGTMTGKFKCQSAVMENCLVSTKTEDALHDSSTVEMHDPTFELSLKSDGTQESNWDDVSIEECFSFRSGASDPALPLEKEIIQVPLMHEKDCKGTWKTILLVGADGSGKSSTANAMVNYLMGVKDQDPFRYQLSTNEGNSGPIDPTTTPAVYHFYPTRPGISYGVTLIDTPAYGDGTVNSQRNWQTIRRFFKAPMAAQQHRDSSPHIDAVCFTVRANCARFTANQQYMYRQLVQWLGKEDAMEKLFLFFTFCKKVKKLPKVARAIRRAGISLRRTRCVKLNNSATYDGFESVPLFRNISHGVAVHGAVDVSDSTSSSECSTAMEENMDNLDGNGTKAKLSWDEACQSLGGFFSMDIFANSCCGGSGTNLQEKESLENFLVAMNTQIRTKLDTLHCIRQTFHRILLHQEELNANPEIKIMVSKPSFCKIALRGKGSCATVCLVCNSTCCECNVSCHDMTEGGCSACPQRQCCLNSELKVLPYLMEHSIREVQQVLWDKREADQASSQGIFHTDWILQRQLAMYEETKGHLAQDLEIVRQSLERLRSISHRNPPGQEVDPQSHLEQMIYSELARREEGFESRVDVIRSMLPAPVRSSILLLSPSPATLLLLSDSGDNRDEFVVRAKDEIHQRITEWQRGKMIASATSVVARLCDMTRNGLGL